MKIPKKHAVMLAEFLVDYIDKEFWPEDTVEEVFMAKILGFGVYHSIVKIDKGYRHKLDKIGVGPLPPARLCARMDVEPQEADAFMEMLAEYNRLHNGGEIYEPLRRFMLKELIDATN